jgi:hypothetical protein
VSHWSFVVGAYALTYGVLLVYWWRVERGIRAAAPPAESR